MKRALITGVAGGIGLATARLLVHDGWEVTGIDLAPPDDAAGHGVQCEVCDLSDPDETVRVVKRLAAGHLDLLVANAAVQPAGGVLQTTVSDWDLAFSVNVRSVMLAIRAAFPALKVAGGAVVVVGSVHSRATTTNRCAYVASKGAVAALTRMAALELANDGIRVNAVLPGAVDTAMLAAGLGAGGQTAEQLAERTPLGRVASPEEVARVIRFLGGPNASYITGQELVVDGGVLARLASE